MEVSCSLDKLVELDPLRDPHEFSIYIWRYLKPSQTKPAPRAHLFTINGLTYPIQRDYGFAAVPDPAEIVGGRYSSQSFVQRSKRRYSMLAYLYSVRPCDLIFFFQADPQYPQDIWNRRGFRGIWIVASHPFRDTTSVRHPQTGYEILGACPHCGSPFDFGKDGLVNGTLRCLNCGKEYGAVILGGKKYSKVVLSARFLIKPLFVFKKTAGDNRVYSDLSISPLIWISRTDNAMGPGKGSTIRTLLPEEAAKIAYMLATEDSQAIDKIMLQRYPGTPVNDITDYNGQPSTLLRAVREGGSWRLEHELQLNLYFALNIDNPSSNIQQLLHIPLHKVDWWTTEFPWGYTGDTADFTLTLWDDNMGRYFIYLFEFKRDVIDREALAEIILYVPWVAQILTSTVTYVDQIEVQPVLVGRENDLKLKYVPDQYTLNLYYSIIPRVDKIIRNRRIIVNPPIILLYSIQDCKKVVNDKYRGIQICYVENPRLTRAQLNTRPFNPPPPTFTTTGVERKWVTERYLEPQGF